MDLPLIIQQDGTIYFYKDIEDEQQEKISNYLKQTAIQIQHKEEIEIYKLEDLRICISLCN